MDLEQLLLLARGYGTICPEESRGKYVTKQIQIENKNLEARKSVT